MKTGTAAAVFCAIVIAIASFWTFTRFNDFPWYYHPDEPGKVEQVRTGNWNYHHPMLMLFAVRASLPDPAAAAPQSVVERGRAVSALFASLAVALLCVCAWRAYSPLAGAATGLLLMTHHQLFELAHYLKEDTSLLAGVAAFFLALHACERKPGIPRLLLLGAGCGLAASGKYIGAVLLIPAALLAWRQRKVSRPVALFTLLAGCAVAFALLNTPLLLNFGEFKASFSREMEFVVEGQKGSTRDVPHTEYLSAFRDNTTPVLWFLLGLALYNAWRTRFQMTFARWVTLLFPFAYLVLLSFSPKSNDRYFLPCTALFVLLAATALPSLKRAAIPVLAAGVIANVFSPPDPVDWPTLTDYLRAFRTDDRADLRRWVEQNIPQDAIIAQDSRAGLPVTGAKPEVAERQEPLPHTVLGKKQAASLGSIDELRTRGVRYVIASQSDYGRYYRRRLKPKEGAEDEFSRSRAFYDQLFREGRLLWKRERGTVIYLHPGIEVYDIAPNAEQR